MACQPATCGLPLPQPAVGSGSVRASLGTLPNEILLQVFDQLGLEDVVVPSRIVTEQPSPEILSRTDCPLKDLTTVCKKWRRLLLDKLFKHSRLSLDDEPRWLIFRPSMLRKLKGRELSEDEFSLSEIVQAHLEQGHLHHDMDGYDIYGMRYIPDGMRYIPVGDRLGWIHDGDIKVWLPSARRNLQPFLEFIKRNGLERKVASVLVYTAQDCGRAVELHDVASLIARETCKLWKTLFSTLDPDRVVIAAPPKTMTFLTNSRMDTGDDWLFTLAVGCYHMLEYHQSRSKFCAELPQGGCPTTLHNIRPWTSLRYNEGSYVELYKRYEWHNHNFPATLRHIIRLLGNEQHVPNPSILSSFHYQAIFPSGSSVSLLCDELMRIRTLRNVEVQIVPGPRSSILDGITHGMMSAGDCWSEARDAYTYIRRWLKCIDCGRIKIMDDWDSDMASAISGLSFDLGAVGWVKGDGAVWEKELDGK